MLNLIKKLAIQDSSNIANVIQLDNIMSGVDGASTFGYSLTPTAVQVNDNQRQQYKFTHQFDVRTLDPTSTDREKLAVIEANQTTVVVSGISENGFVSTRGRLTRHDQYDQVVADRFLVTADTVSGYNPGYYSGDNLFGQFNLPSPTVTASISGNAITASGEEITVTKVTGANPVPIANIYSSSLVFFMPFVGESLTLQIEVISATTTIGTASLQLRFLNSAGGTISTSSATITGAGNVTTSSVIPAGTVSIYPLLVIGTGVGDDVVFKKPLLSRGTTIFTL